MVIALVLGLHLGPTATAMAEGPDYNPQPSPDANPGNPFDSALQSPDGTAPQTKIERSVLRVATRTAKFWFSANEPVQGFLCQLDKVNYKPCGSPRTYKHLKAGGHTFRARAVDVAGNVDPTPAIVRFKIPKPHRGRR